MKAHGVPALIRHLAGEITLEQAAVIGRADTRHYAKRQFTWFRHQLPEFEWVKPEAARGWLQTCHSGALVKRANPECARFRDVQSRHPRSARRAPRNDGVRRHAWLEP